MVVGEEGEMGRREGGIRSEKRRGEIGTEGEIFKRCSPRLGGQGDVNTLVGGEQIGDRVHLICPT